MGASDPQPQASGWPALRVDDWTDTFETLHMWLQIVGKVRLVKAPMLNHWWQATTYVTPRGLTTGSIPDPAIPFADHEQHASYDADAVQLFWRQLVQADRVMRAFRARYTGKVSPCICSGARWTSPARASRAPRRRATPAALRTAATGSRSRATRTSCRVAASGRAAARRAPSTPTPTPSPTGFRTCAVAPGLSAPALGGDPELVDLTQR